MSEEEKSKHDAESQLVDLKLKKQRAKTEFTRKLTRLIKFIKEDEPKELVAEQTDKVEEVMDDAIQAVTDVVLFYKEHSRTEEMKKTVIEIEQIQKKYDDCISLEPAKSTKCEVSDDMYKQLRRVSIPVFSGEKRQYDFWKSAFYACVDSTKASDEYKFLQLRQYLAGDALRLIDGLGHTSESYKAAKERLERKYGGDRRQMSKYLEDLDKFEMMREESPKKIEKFAELVDMIVINLKEKKKEDLKDGVLYLQIQKKMTEGMIRRYHQWLFDNEEEESVLALTIWLIREAEYNIVAEEIVHGMNGNTSRDKRHREKRSHQHETYFNNDRNQYQEEKKAIRNCRVCGDVHGAWACPVFKAMNVNNRWEKAKEEKLCFRCLGTNHQGMRCQRGRTCGIDGCVKSHNRLLHTSQIKPAEQKNERTINNIVHTTLLNTKRVALRTVPVLIKGNNRTTMKVNALLDDASTKTYINTSVAHQLGLTAKTEQVTVNVINGKTETFETMPVKMLIESEDHKVKMTIEAHTTDNVTGDLQTVDWNQYSSKYKHLQGIEFPYIHSNEKVDMLIGIDYLDLHAAIFESRGQPGEPVARLTPLGWTCVGKLSSDQTNETSHYTYFTHNNELDRAMERFWELESVQSPESCEMNRVDRKIVDDVNQTIKHGNNRYEIGVPWKGNRHLLQNNHEMAMKRLQSTEKRLKKDPQVKQAYKETFENYERKGYVSRVEDCDKLNGNQWFLPHFPVIRPDKSTTKVRVVFDASAKDNGVSLNDVIYQGPKLQAELPDVLLRFRHHPIAVVCDIQEMYLQIGIPASDRQYFCFLWRDSPQDEPEQYQFNRLVFGVNASPFLAQHISQVNARKFSSEYPLAADTVLHSTYMDDSMSSVLNEDQGVKLYHELSQLWHKAGMYARKWLSNSRTVLEHIPEKDRVIEFDLSKGELPVLKTLGIAWNSNDDEFTFHCSDQNLEKCTTKRQFLSKISSLYDPLGFLSPFTARTKMLMQEVWLNGTDWDTDMPEQLQKEIETWFSELQELDSIRVARCIKPANTKKSTLHTFVDASSKGYGSVIYARNEEQDKVSVRLVAAKSHVAPLKAVSIPRLELMAAVLGVRLANSVCKPLDTTIDEVTFWSDSLNVLWWIHGQSRKYKTFVANRVGEIHDSTRPGQWQYVPTKSNPADPITRGLTLKELTNSDLWWNGPDFLQEDPECWPKKQVQSSVEAVTEVKRDSQPCDFTCFTTQRKGDTEEENEDRLDPDRYSDWVHYVRVYAWVNRFIDNCHLPKDCQRKENELSVVEIISAENKIISRAQQLSFRDEYQNLAKNKPVSKRSKLLSLNPKLDEDGMIRSDSRLKYADHLSYHSRFPVILPRKNRVTKLIVKHHHEQQGHHGTSQTLASLSSRYWLISGREEVRDYERECRECRRRKSKAADQIMAPLPDLRLGKSMRAFSNTAVDFAGPFSTKQGRGKSRAKRYLCVFTCMDTRAVHLEVAYGLDTDTFLNCFYRFCSRRGLPEVVVSDNGTNFVGACKELRELIEQIDKDNVTKHCARNHIKWIFNPPCAPHFGGVHESMVKCAKRAIFNVLGTAEVTDEELQTAVTGAEGLINSRPLTYQTTHPEDDVVLTPNHFLHGQVGGRFAPEIVDITNFSVTRRWRYVQELLKHFWQRWMREFLPTLGQRKKWNRETRDFQTDDVVLVVDPETTRGHWPLGRIVQVFPGSDGHVRVVNVQIKNKVLKRPITRLCLIEESAH